MPWFRHEATAHRDPRIIEVIDEFGPAGHFVWWQLNEVCCLEDGPIVFPEGNWKRVAKLLDIPPDLTVPLDKVVEFLVANRLVSRTKSRGSRTTVSLEPTNRIKYLPPKSQTPEAQRERKRRSRAKRSRNSHSDMSQDGHSDTSTDVTPYETKRNDTKQNLVPTGPAKPVFELAATHLSTVKNKVTNGSGFDLLHEFKEVWPKAWQDAVERGINPKAVAIQLIGSFIATVTETEPDYGRAGQLVGRFGKLALLGMDEGLMANADDPYRYAFRVCANHAQRHRAEATA